MIEYAGRWYLVEHGTYLGKDDYFATVYQGNSRKPYHTTGSYATPEEAETAAKAVIDFINDYEEWR